MVIIYCSASILKDVCTPYENWPNMAGMGRGSGRVDKCYKLSNRGGCGGGWWTDRPPIFHFIPWIGSRSNSDFFPRFIFVAGIILKVIVFLGISFGWSKKPAKQGNEIKTKNLSQRTLPAFILCRTFTQRMTNELFPPKNKPPQASVQLGTQRLGKMSNSEIQWIRTWPDKFFLSKDHEKPLRTLHKFSLKWTTKLHSPE